MLPTGAVNFLRAKFTVCFALIVIINRAIRHFMTSAHQCDGIHLTAIFTSKFSFTPGVNMRPR